MITVLHPKRYDIWVRTAPAGLAVSVALSLSLPLYLYLNPLIAKMWAFHSLCTLLTKPLCVCGAWSLAS